MVDVLVGPLGASPRKSSSPIAAACIRAAFPMRRGTLLSRVRMASISWACLSSRCPAAQGSSSFKPAWIILTFGSEVSEEGATW